MWALEPPIKNLPNHIRKDSRILIFTPCAKILYINRLCITLYCAVLDSEHQALCGKNTRATLLRHTLKKISTHHSLSDMSSRENMSHSIDSVNIYIHSLYIQERTYNKPSPLSPHIPFSIAYIALSILPLQRHRVKSQIMIFFQLVSQAGGEGSSSNCFPWLMV